MAFMKVWLEKKNTLNLEHDFFKIASEQTKVLEQRSLDG